MPVALVLTSTEFVRTNSLVKGLTPNTPRKEMVPMDTVFYVVGITLAFASNITAAILVEKFKKMGLIKCETDL